MTDTLSTYGTTESDHIIFDYSLSKFSRKINSGGS